MYAYVVVDSSTYLSDAMVSVIDVSDVIVLIATQDFPAIKNARLFLDLLQTLGIDRERIVFTMNRYDKRYTTVTPELLSKNLKQEIVAVIPLDERAAITAVTRGIPFMLDNKNQPISRGVFSLAEKVRSQLTSADSEAVERPAKR